VRPRERYRLAVSKDEALLRFSLMDIKLYVRCRSLRDCVLLAAVSKRKFQKDEEKQICRREGKDEMKSMVWVPHTTRLGVADNYCGYFEVA